MITLFWIWLVCATFFLAVALGSPEFNEDFHD